MLLKWLPAGPVTSPASQLYNISKPGRGWDVREVTGQDPVDWFNKIADPTTVKPHWDPIQAMKGGLRGDVPGGGSIGYRPIIGPRSGGNVSIDLFNVLGQPFPKVTYHFLP